MKNIIILASLILVLQSCAQNSNKLENSDCIVSKESIKEILAKGYKEMSSEELSSAKEIGVQFFNNPYAVDSTYQLALILANKTILYNGTFNQYLKVKIPSTAIGGTQELKFILSKKNKSYTFNTQATARIDSTDDILEIIFIPKESYWFTFYFHFTQNGKNLK
ncbi:MAG TPA: hypothetical protein VFM99_09720 [Chitinophagales bacterium]|nr:hypothetical protein [Chitinophagales bacterium]